MDYILFTKIDDCIKGIRLHSGLVPEELYNYLNKYYSNYSDVSEVIEQGHCLLLAPSIEQCLFIGDIDNINFQKETMNEFIEEYCHIGSFFYNSTNKIWHPV